MLCGQCGADNRDGAVLCHHCKNPLQASAAQSANAKGGDSTKNTKSGLGTTLLTGLGMFVGFAIGTGGYYIYSLQDDPASPIITMPEPISKRIEPPMLGTAPVSEVTPAEAEQTAAAETPAENNNNAEVATVLLDPTAPCPSKTFSCIGGSSDNIRDASCIADKPVWTYFSADKGVTWTSAGCYATEDEARTGLGEARKIAFLKPTKQESKPAELVVDKAKNETAKKQANDKHENHVAEQKPAANAEAHEELPVSQPSYTTAAGTSYKAQFKGAFGLILMEERHYPTAEMKQKALELWDKKQEILEPDGTINDKYVVKQPKAGGIPGFTN